MKWGAIGVFCLLDCLAPSSPEDRGNTKPPLQGPIEETPTVMSRKPNPPPTIPSQPPPGDHELVIPPGPVSDHFLAPDRRRRYTFGRNDGDGRSPSVWIATRNAKIELGEADRLVPWAQVDLRGRPVEVPLDAPPPGPAGSVAFLNATTTPEEPALLVVLYASSSQTQHRELVLMDAQTMAILWRERLTQLAGYAEQFETLTLQFVLEEEGSDKLSIELVQHVLPQAGDPHARMPGPPLKQRFIAQHDGHYVRDTQPRRRP